MTTPKQYNFVTGEWETPAPPDPDAPSAAWIAGWNACINREPPANPYTPATLEHHDWEEGWTDADGN